MEKFHSTVSRRDFMKGLGLVGAGLGTASVIAPDFNDLDDMSQATGGNYSQPWWVKEKNQYQPTSDVDWDILSPFSSDGQGYRFGVNSADSTAMAKKNSLDTELEGYFKQNKPGFALRDKALNEAASFGAFGKGLQRYDFTGIPVSSPEDRGVPKYSGSIEENANMIRAAFHYLGMPEVGFLALDDKVKKLLPKSGIRFEDVEHGYVDSTTRQDVFPNKAKYLIIAMTRKDVAITKHGGGHPYSYGYSTIHGHRAQAFVKSLGYEALQISGYDNVGYGVLAGMAELGRINHSVTPKYGTAIRLFNIFATDLPLPESSPIDAGIFKFCYTCKLCAEICHEHGNTALSLETEPTWDLPNTLNLPSGNTWNRPGLRRWACDFPACGICHIKCHWQCVFNQLEQASAHMLVRATSAITPLFNGFFTEMDKIFGYEINTYEEIFSGMENWWNRDLNGYKYDAISNSDGLR